MDDDTILIAVKESASEIELPIGTFGAVTGQLTIRLHDHNENQDDVASFVAQHSFSISQIPAMETFLTISNPIIDDEVVEDTEVVFFEATGTVNGFPFNRIYEIEIEDDDLAPTFLSVSVTEDQQYEGNGSQITEYLFEVKRSGNLEVATSASYMVTGEGNNPADMEDFSGNRLPEGDVLFLAGETMKEVIINVVGDEKHEPDEQFSFIIQESAVDAQSTQFFVAETSSNEDIIDRIIGESRLIDILNEPIESLDDIYIGRDDSVEVIAGSITIETGSAVATILNDDEILNGPEVFRFFNTETNVHFYTPSVGERDAIEDTLDQFEFEGPSFRAANPEGQGSREVYRFFNTETNVHFYTISESEKEQVQNNLPQFEFEGIGYYAYNDEVEGSIPLFRFFNPTTGTHFYTPDEAEKELVEATLDQFELEGIAYYVDPLF